MVKKLRRWFLALMYLAGSVLSGMPAGAQAHHLLPEEPLVGHKIIRVAVDRNFPPFSFMDGTGKLRGYERDLWQLFERQTGVAVQFLPLEWASAMQAVLDGRADVVTSMHPGAQRTALFELSAPYMPSAVGIYTDQNIRGIIDIESLRGFPVGVQRGDSCHSYLRERGISEFRAFEQHQDIFAAAAAGDLRVFCMDEYPANYFLYRNEAPPGFELAFELRQTELHRAVRRGNTRLLQFVESAMAQIDSAELQRLHERWLEKPHFMDDIWRVLIVAAVAAGALIALMLLWVHILRRSVAQRTRQLAQEKNQLQALFDAIPDAIILKNLDGFYRGGNLRAAQLFGLQPQQLYGYRPQHLLSPENSALIREKDQLTAKTGLMQSYLLTAIGRDGLPWYREIRTAALRDAEGAVSGTLSVVRNVTERVQMEQSLRLAGVAFEAQEALLVLDADGRIGRVNRAFSKLTGYSGADVLGQAPDMFVSSQQGGGFFAELRAHLDDRDFWQGEIWLEQRDDRPLAVRAHVSVVRGEDGALGNYVCALTDLTREREAYASANQIRFFDPLTDLPNRNYLFGQLQHITEDQSVHGTALILLDLDHFKRINDLRGHAAGDCLLIAIAQRLRALPAEGDVLARLNGGMFAWLSHCRMADGCGPQGCGMHAAQDAQRLHQAFQESFVLTGMPEINISASVGWAFLRPGEVADAYQIFQRAELALYAAKAAGRNQVCHFSAEMLAALQEREGMLQELRESAQDLRHRGLELYGQLQKDADGQAVGAELLMRWTRASGQIVAPDQFIALAEEHGLIQSMGCWALETACAQLASWGGMAATAGLSLAVNVSAHQLAEKHFCEMVIAIVQRYRINPALLYLEITESTILQNLATVSHSLEVLRGHGLQVSLDDFGTGYSSLAYLSRLPIDQLKIDRSFVGRLPDSESDALVVETIISLAHGLGLQVVAEGVETAAQREFLLARGCDVLQGYLLARPVQLTELDKILISE